MHQMSLTFEPGLAQKYRDMRECFASCVYARGLGRVAAEVDVQPSNLSAMLAGERNLDTALIERYMDRFKDYTPALYMAARWLTDANTLQAQALAQIPALVADLQRLAAMAGGSR
jgi:hypothetical protein